MKKIKKVRYAVVGLGAIAQGSVLPAFGHAKNSELTALVSGDPKKLRVLGRKYGVTELYSYDRYEELLDSGKIDAVYIATPNNTHARYAERAAECGIHILCEKPLAPTEEECRTMTELAAENGVQLMTAYRLHFDPANLEAARLAQSGALGELRVFNSAFTMQVNDRGNIRLHDGNAGGPLYDIGVYCINAARYLFRDEPVEAFAASVNSADPRFSEVEESVSVSLKFPRARLANFVLSFGASPAGDYQLIGTKGKLELRDAYDYACGSELRVTVGKKERRHKYPKRDQFAPELVYFSDCIRRGKTPEPSGQEGLIDIQIVEALQKSLDTGAAVTLDAERKLLRPSMRQRLVRPSFKTPRLYHATQPDKRT